MIDSLFDMKLEENIIGAIIHIPRLQDVAKVVNVIGDKFDVFRNGLYRFLYERIYKYYTENKPLSYEIFLADVRGDAKMKPHLAKFLDIPSVMSVNLEPLTQKLYEYYMKRKMNELGNRIIQSISNGEDIFDLMRDIEDTNQNLISSVTKTTTTVRNAVENIYESIQKKRAGEIDNGISSGFIDLDDMVVGLNPGDLFVIGARPSMGKTAFALSMMSNLVKKGKKPGLFSLEMDISQIMMRMMSIDLEIPLKKIRMGDINDRDEMFILDYLDKSSESLYKIYDKAGITINEINGKILDWQRNGGVDIVFIDYLGLIKPLSGKNREQEVSGISLGLKNLARQLKVPIVLLTQLNRAIENRADKRPLLSDIRESGSVEQDADIIMFIHRPERVGEETYNGIDAKGLAVIDIAKQRNGEIGQFLLNYDHDFTRFRNYLGEDRCDTLEEKTLENPSFWQDF